MVPACIAALALSVCAASPAPRETPDFDSLLEKDWRLIEVRQGDDSVSLDRPATDDMEDVFTLRFDSERISGRAFPNRYFGPYSRGKGQAITIGEVAATLMASFKELDALTEKEYFRYLAGVQSWNLVQGRLELHAAASDGFKAVLVFTAD
jgi:heat shock protein HslJ